MATPSENATILIRYWQDAVNVSTWERDNIGGTQWPARLANAARAMRELLASGDRQTFATSSIFETCLTLEAAGVTDRVLATPVGRIGAGGSSPPRQLMLDHIYSYATGGWWAPPPSSGVTEWLHSAIVSAGAIASTVLVDALVSVRAVACKLVQDAAMPRFWAEFLLQQRTFTALEEQIKTSKWSWAERLTLNALASGAGARVLAEVARYAAVDLPSFPTGDGAATATLPPRGKPPWRDARVISATILGLITGGAVASKR